MFFFLKKAFQVVFCSLLLSLHLTAIIILVAHSWAVWINFYCGPTITIWWNVTMAVETQTTTVWIIILFRVKKTHSHQFRLIKITTTITSHSNHTYTCMHTCISRSASRFTYSLRWRRRWKPKTIWKSSPALFFSRILTATFIHFCTERLRACHISN